MTIWDRDNTYSFAIFHDDTKIGIDLDLNEEIVRLAQAEGFQAMVGWVPGYPAPNLLIQTTDTDRLVRFIEAHRDEVIGHDDPIDLEDGYQAGFNQSFEPFYTRQEFDSDPSLRDQFQFGKLSEFE